MADCFLRAVWRADTHIIMIQGMLCFGRLCLSIQSSCADGSEECSTSGREYLAYFLHRHLDFRLPEIDSLLELAGQGKLMQSRWRQPYGKHFYSPFWYLQLPSEAVAQEVAARSILLKVCPV